MNMHKLNILLFFFIFGVTCLVHSKEPEELYEGKVELEEAGRSLHTIKSNEALPLVLFRDKYKNLHNPENLLKVRSLDGKMIKGTEFTTEISDIVSQMFFCPKNVEEKCLVGTMFEEHENLQCASEPIPIIKLDKDEKVCGSGNKIGFYERFVYQICKGQDEIDTRVIPIYRYCKDKKQKTLFTIHTIHSPNLLAAKLLLREREITYPIIMYDGTKISFKRGPDGTEVYEPATSKPGYRWRTLVQSDDMALALWRKPTFHKMNLALQHENLIKLWDNIGEYVRSHAVQSSNDDGLSTVVYTGVFDLKSESEIKNDDQLSNIWVKLVMTTNSISGSTSYVHQGVAILMNNFVDTEPSLSPSSNPDRIKTYCDQDLCIKTLKDEFKNAKGRVRCCLVTTKILDLFNHRHMEVKELYIHNVNFEKDQEILKNKQNEGTEDQPVESIREIQPDEILPIILYYYKEKSELYFPRYILRIITKDRRIVDGSLFLSDDFYNQVLFCPSEDSNATYLLPRTFNRFEPLQCTKQPVPMVKPVFYFFKKNIQCGVDGNSILYKVVYEFKIEIPSHEVKNMNFYEFCYNPIKQKVVYTHHELLSPILLYSKLLFWERKVEFPMPMDTPLPLANLEELQDAIKKENNTSTSPTDAKKSAYKLQKLVPSEDMAFAAWKIPTYLLVNVAFQHESLILLWKQINRKVTDYIRATGSNNISTYNGVMDLQTTLLDADQKPQMWFKIIYNKLMDLNKTEEGIVILMQNYLIPKTDQSTLSNTEKNALEPYCEKNLCLDEFQSKFTKIGGQVICCRLTTKIAQSFGIPNVRKDNKVLSIHGIISINDDIF